ncbi:hypothetical protein [Streptomyces sp. Je 1-332]
MRQVKGQRSDGEGVNAPAAGRYVDATAVGDVHVVRLGIRVR